MLYAGRMSHVAVITGTTHGIGRVTARELAKAGFTVVMLCRDQGAAAFLDRAVRHPGHAVLFAALPGPGDRHDGVVGAEYMR